MAIGTIAAIGLGLGAVGSVVGASSKNKAADKAADVSLQVAEKNNALAREIYGKNEGYLSPYMARGNVAGDAINAMLGLPSVGGGAAGSPAGGSPAGPFALPAGYGTGQAARGDGSGFSAYGAVPQNGANVGGQLSVNHDLTPQQAAANAVNAPSGVNWQNYIDSQADVKYDYGLHSGMSPEEYGAWHWERDGARRDLAPFMAGPATASGTATTITPSSARDGFKNYIANSDYGFQFGEGSNALNSGYAGAGTLQSGAAMKALEKYRQDLQSGYRQEYMGHLANQQGVGLSGASALAGVGQNYVSNVSANNNAAGTAQANALLSKGANNPFAGALGLIGGGLFGLGK